MAEGRFGQSLTVSSDIGVQFAANKLSREDVDYRIAFLSPRRRQAIIHAYELARLTKMIHSGPPDAPIMLVGEIPGPYELAANLPFIGPSGNELRSMLSEAGIPISSCFMCNVTDRRGQYARTEDFFLTKTQAQKLHLTPFLGKYPTNDLRIDVGALTDTIASVKPKVVIALGELALWALSGHTGIGKWRGSQLDGKAREHTYSLVPTFNPAYILREMALRNICVHDLRRAERVFRASPTKPEWNFHVRPHYTSVSKFLYSLLDHRRRRLACAVDIETRGGQIACVGIATSKLNAMCIPLMCIERQSGYWTAAEELQIILLLREALTMPGGPVVFQNGSYDLQYFARQFLFIPQCSDDTMLMQHVIFPGLRKGLDFLSSLYCEYHCYWKDDGKTWDKHTGEEQLWRYNCEDAVRTFECWEVLKGLVSDMGMSEQYGFQMRLFHAAVRMMLRGIPVDNTRKVRLSEELRLALIEREEWFKVALGHPLNPRSTKQMHTLFYGDFALKPIMKRTPLGSRPTLDDKALKTIERRQPLLTPLIHKIEEFRSIGVFKSTFADMLLSPDGRMRTSINLAGTETFRFSSSEDAFGFGGNLQNLPVGTEDE